MWTLRASVGGQAGGPAAYAPVRASAGVFLPFGGSEVFGFWGVELDVDAARASPMIAALNLVPRLSRLGLPFKVGVAVPWAIGASATEPSLGLLVRLFVESESENEYGR
jgi:hypothetical protein